MIHGMPFKLLSFILLQYNNLGFNNCHVDPSSWPKERKGKNFYFMLIFRIYVEPVKTHAFCKVFEPLHTKKTNYLYTSQCQILVQSDQNPIYIMDNDTSNVTDRVFAIFSKVYRYLNENFREVEKYIIRILEAHSCEKTFFIKCLRHLKAI